MRPEAIDVRAALDRGFVLTIAAATTAAETGAAFPRLASFEHGGVFAGRFVGRTPWERHPGGDPRHHCTPALRTSWMAARIGRGGDPPCARTSRAAAGRSRMAPSSVGAGP